MKTLWILLFLSSSTFLSSQTDGSALYQQGLDQLKSGELQKAASLFQSIVDADKKDSQAWCGLGRALDGLNPGSAEGEALIDALTQVD